jgi:hypothetical protein
MSLESRVARLERRCPVEFTQPPPPPLAPYLIAFHVGKWQRHESPAETYHRALGVFQFASLNIDALNERTWPRYTGCSPIAASISTRCRGSKSTRCWANWLMKPHKAACGCR